MTTITAAIFLASVFLLSATATYAWWCYVRGWIVRQDLFAIRDRLWDQMQQAGKLDDPEYLDARENLNSLIRLAPEYSFPLFAYFVFLAWDDDEEEEILEMSIPEVEEAIIASVDRMAYFVIRETLGGVIVFGLLRPFLSSERLARGVAAVLASAGRRKSVQEASMILAAHCSTA